MPPAEVFTTGNEKLCEGNEAEMFATAWLVFLDLNTGLVRMANAGHNSPVLIYLSSLHIGHIEKSASVVYTVKMSGGQFQKSIVILRH